MGVRIGAITVQTELKMNLALIPRIIHPLHPQINMCRWYCRLPSRNEYSIMLLLMRQRVCDFWHVFPLQLVAGPNLLPSDPQ